MTFTQSQGGNDSSQPLTISNPGCCIQTFTVQATTQDGGAWLSVGPPVGEAKAGAPATVNVIADPGDLLPGTYTGMVTVSGALLPVGVTMTIAPAKPILLLSVTALGFTAVTGGGAPLPQNFGVLNIGQGIMNWTAQASVLSKTPNWLSLSTASGTVTRPFLDLSLVNVSIDPAALASGTYYGQIQVAAPGVDNSPQTISVVLTVLPAGSNPGPDLRPTGLIFAGPQSPNPPAQTVQIANTSAKPIVYTSGTLTLPGVPVWFSNTPPSNSINAGKPLTLTISPDFSHLSAGASRGQISFLFDDGTSRDIALLAVVPPSAAATGSGAEPRAAACTPSQLNIQPSGAPLPLSASIGQPVTMDVLVADDCGQPVTPATPGAAIQVSFSNGDPAGGMVHMGSGRWVRTWQPQKAVAANTPSAATVTAFEILANGKVLANQMDLSVAFGPPSRIPVVKSGGVLNAASLTGSVPVAPGGLITITGANLANGGAAASAAAPLPCQLGNTQVLVAGRCLPLLYASDGQINAQLPYDLPPNIPAQLVVESGDTLSVPEPITVAPAQPAIFTTNQSGQGAGVIFNSDGITLAQAGTGMPAHTGETIVIYGAGLGPVSPPVDTGAPAPSSPPASTVNPVTITIGGQAAQVVFAGLTPGIAGVYQVNAVVPPGVTPGNAVPVVIAVAGQMSPAVTMAVQ